MLRGKGGGSAEGSFTMYKFTAKGRERSVGPCLGDLAGGPLLRGRGPAVGYHDTAARPLHTLHTNRRKSERIFFWCFLVCFKFFMFFFNVDFFTACWFFIFVLGTVTERKQLCRRLLLLVRFRTRRPVGLVVPVEPGGAGWAQLNPTPHISGKSAVTGGVRQSSSLS